MKILYIGVRLAVR